MAIPSFPESQLNQLSQVLVDTVTHRELSDLFASLSIDEQGGQPKWERILLALRTRQKQDRCGNNVGAFIQATMDPVRFVIRPEEFTSFQQRLNLILAFSALKLHDNGKLIPIDAAKTLTEAQQRASQLRKCLAQRNVHPDVLEFCRAELLADNYFHAVLEATKSVAEKIRQKTGLNSDGETLISEAFGLGASGIPVLAFNSLQTKTEKSEHKGVVNLLRGMFSTFRNATAHEPKIFWAMDEQDALDLMSLASLLHRRVDKAILIRKGM